MNNKIGINNGLINERKILKCLDNKRKSDLSDHFYSFISLLFPNSEEDDVIYCKSCDKTSKPDIAIFIGNDVRYVSIKSGKNDAVHLEDIKPFILFLRKIGVSSETQKTILLWQYGDLTLDGSGDVRYGYDELRIMLKDRIMRANIELNSPRIIYEVFHRACVTGNETKNIFVDYFYYGSERFGITIHKNDLIDYVLSKKHFSYKTIHIGPMTLQPYLRDINRVSKHMYKRNMIQVKWHYMNSDIEYALDYISDRYNK